MTKYLLPLILIANIAWAQEVQWASSVEAVSSEFRYDKFPQQYLAKEILGAPSTLSINNANPCAWAPEVENRVEGEYIQVGFSRPSFIQQVLIHETFNPGSIRKITILGANGESKVVYVNDSIEKLNEARMLQVKMARTPFKVSSVKIEMETSKVAGYNQIDAVGIADHQVPFLVKINVNPEVEKEEIRVENLGENINSPSDDLSPVIAPNGKTLYLTRQGHSGNIGESEKQDVWYSEVAEDGSFGLAKNLGAPINNSANNSVLTVTPDGQKMLLLNRYLPNGEMEKGLSMSVKESTGWTLPKDVLIDEYYNNSDYGEYCLSNSGNVLIMTIMYEGTEGNKDIYVSFRKEDGTWTKPKSLGPVVNTAASEISPFLASDERTLYFGSAGHPGYGSADIFVTRRLDDTWQNWSVPENLGPYLNSNEFDAYYTLPAKGDYVYFVSYREGSLGGSDIFRAPVPKSLRPDPVALVHGVVRNKKTSESVATTIEYYSLKSGEKVGEAKSDPVTGAYEIVLPSGDKYGFFAKKDGFLPVSSEFELKKTDKYTEKEVDLYLVPIEKDASIVINNVYFDTDKYILRKESHVELKQLAMIMKEYPGMKVEISGHTDDVGNDAYNQTLSNNRAKAVMDYLVSAGISKERLLYKGYGKSRPITPNIDAASRQLNRRVEFKILDL